MSNFDILARTQYQRLQTQLNRQQMYAPATPIQKSEDFDGLEKEKKDTIVGKTKTKEENN